MHGKLVWDVAIAYGVFLVLALAVSLVSDSGLVIRHLTLADLLSGNAGLEAISESSAKGTMLVLLATATIAIPVFWKHRLAPLAYAVPLVFTLAAFRPLYEEHRARRDAIEALGELGDVIAPAVERMSEFAGSPLENLGVGAYVLFATAVYLAVRGVMRAFAR